MGTEKGFHKFSLIGSWVIKKDFPGMLGERYTIPEPVRKLRTFLPKKNALYIPCQYFFKVLQINYGVQNSFQWLFLPVSFSFVILPTPTPLSLILKKWVVSVLKIQQFKMWITHFGYNAGSDMTSIVSRRRNLKLLASCVKIKTFITCKN